MLDRADCADFGCHNSIRLETKHFLNTLALTFISFSGRFVFAMQKHYLFFASDPLVYKLTFKRAFYCVKYHYLILTIAMCWQEQTSTTNSNILKRNILVSALRICDLI